MPYKGVPTVPCEKLAPHHVRKDNVINYRGNYYTVPTGTYNGHQTLVYLEEKEGSLHIYSHETGKTLATHKISQEKGRLISTPRIDVTAKHHWTNMRLPFAKHFPKVQRLMPICRSYAYIRPVTTATIYSSLPGTIGHTPTPHLSKPLPSALRQVSSMDAT